MSKKSHQKSVTTIYDNDLMIIISQLRSNLTALQAKYKNEMTACLQAVPQKVFDQNLRLKLVQELPEAIEFVSQLEDNNCQVKQAILQAQPHQLNQMKLNQEIINQFISHNVKNIHQIPQEWRNEHTIAHFMNTYKGQQCMEIFEDLASYKENLNEYDTDNLQKEFGILSFISDKTPHETIMFALGHNPYAFHTIPSQLQKEEFKLKVLEINPQVLALGSKPMSLTNKIKDACLHVLASMSKLQAKDLVNNAWKSLLNILKERDRQVHIVNNWNFA